MIFVRVKLRHMLFGTASCLIICALTLLGVAFARNATQQVSITEQNPAPVVLLDAGHGGEDGGAVGIGGLVEKDLNLEITLMLDYFLRALGYETILTRAEDVDLHDLMAQTLRTRKVSDIQARFAMMEALREDDLFVSIHMNKFGQASARGTQVFYSQNNPQSSLLAESIQQNVIALLQPENHRQIKPSNDSIYLLYHANRPAVLVECGFISNAAEAGLLQDADYQNQLAFAIAMGIMEHQSEVAR